MDAVDFDEKLRKKAVDLYLAFNTNQDFFTAQLYRLIAKADSHNQTQLALSFPVEVSLYLEWRLSDEREFYERYRMGDLLNDPEKSASHRQSF